MSEQCAECGGDGYYKGPRLGDEPCPTCAGYGVVPPPTQNPYRTQHSKPAPPKPTHADTAGELENGCGAGLLICKKRGPDPEIYRATCGQEGELCDSCTMKAQAAELRLLKARHNPEVCVDVQEHCEKLEAELRLLRQDKERLDWLDHGTTREIGWLDIDGWVVSDTANLDSFIVGTGPTIRTALDTAREAGESEDGPTAEQCSHMRSWGGEHGEP